MNRQLLWWSICTLTLRSLHCDCSQSLMKPWGSRAKLSMNSLWVFRWLMVSMVSWIWTDLDCLVIHWILNHALDSVRQQKGASCCLTGEVTICEALSIHRPVSVASLKRNHSNPLTTAGGRAGRTWLDIKSTFVWNWPQCAGHICSCNKCVFNGAAPSWHI